MLLRHELQSLAQKLEVTATVGPNRDLHKLSKTAGSEPAVLDVSWGGNRGLTGRNQEVWPHAPYVMQS